MQRILKSLFFQLFWYTFQDDARDYQAVYGYSG